MGKKLEGNGLFESSRIILPEHREKLQQHRTELTIHKKPILGEQRVEELARTIAVSIFSNKEVSITVFDEYQDKQYIGKIDKIDKQLRLLKLICDSEFEWIKLDDIVSMELSNDEI